MTTTTTTTLASRIRALRDSEAEHISESTFWELTRIAQQLDNLALETRNHAMIKDATTICQYLDDPQSVQASATATETLLIISDALGDNSDR